MRKWITSPAGVRVASMEIGEACDTVIVEPSGTLGLVVVSNGDWLVMLVASYSDPDRQQFVDVFRSADRLGEMGVKRAVAAFDDPSEAWAWFPELKGQHASPMWLVLSDGHVLLHRTGLVTVDELESAVASVIVAAAEG